MQTFNWVAILLLVGAAHGLFLAVTLFNLRRGNGTANRIFALILTVFAISIVLHTLAYTHQHLLQYPHLSKIEPTLLFLFGPLFYFYIKAMTTSTFKLRKQHGLHFIPFLICVAYLTPYYLQSAEAKIRHILADHGGPCIHCLVLYWAATVQILFYIVFIARLLMRHKLQLKESFSSIEKINLNWLQKLLGAVVITWAVAIVLQLFDPTIETANYIWLVVSANIYLIGYLGLRQPEIFTGRGAKTRNKKYEKSTLTPERAEAYLQKLLDFMAHEKPFLRNDLTLHELADNLATSPHHLSQVINEKLNQNFFEFVNSHRVEEAKQLLLKPENRQVNIAQIGFEAGFNSISAFNAAFKKHAHMTPSDFLKRVGSAKVSKPIPE